MLPPFKFLNMNRRRQIYTILLILTLGVAAASILKSASDNKPDGKTKTPFNLYRVKNLTITQYSGNFLVRRMHADEFRIEPRRFFVFNVKSINEIVIDHAKLSIYLSDKNIDRHVALFGFAGGLFSIKKKGGESEKIFYPADFGLITRAVIKGIQIEIYRNKKPILSITARVGYINLKNKNVEFKDTVFRNTVNEKTVKSRLAVWNSKRQLFIVPRKYIIYRSEHIPDGRIIDIDLKGNIFSATY